MQHLMVKEIFCILSDAQQGKYLHIHVVELCSTAAFLKFFFQGFKKFLP